MAEEKKTSIPLKKSTRDRLRQFGHKGQSWDDVLNQLMDAHKKR